MNGESLVYPRVISGAIVGIDPTDPKPLVIIFQYNPDSLSRTLQPQMGAEGGDKTEALRLKGAPVETIKVDIELDAADQLERDDRTARDMGLYPVLSALEMLVYPRAQRVITNTQLLALGTIEILPPVAPFTVFVWGPQPKPGKPKSDRSGSGKQLASAKGNRRSVPGPSVEEPS